jgi:hypothetical protein
MIDNINMDSTIAGSMNDNINMDSTISVSMNDNINMDSTFMLSIIFVIVCGLFELRRICSEFFLPLVYICIAVADAVINRGGLSSYSKLPTSTKRTITCHLT